MGHPLLPKPMDASEHLPSPLPLTRSEMGLFCGAAGNIQPSTGHSLMHGGNRRDPGTVPQGNLARVAAKTGWVLAPGPKEKS